MSNRPAKTLLQRAHVLKPVVMIGNKGLTEAVDKEIDIALDAHELIKIKISANDKDEKQQILAAIIEKHKAQMIQSIGYMATIFRKRKS